MVNVIKGFFAILLTCMLACMAYVHFNQAGLSKKVFSLLRSQLATELEVGAFEVDVLTAFPRVAFNLQEVVLKGKGGGDLMAVDRLRATISLLSALSGDVQIRRISLTDGELSVRVLKDGTLSLEVTKQGAEQEGHAPQLAFHRIDLKNILMHYDDPHSNSEFAVKFLEGSVNGSYKYDRLELDVEGDVIHERVRFGNDVFLNGAKGKLSGHLDLNFGDKLYTFDDVAIIIGAQTYEIQGSIRDAGDYQYVDMQVAQTKGQFASFLSILPERYRAELPFSDIQGVIVASGTIRGRMNATENPHIHFDFQAKQARLKSRNGMGTLEDLDISGAFDNGAFRRLQSSSVQLPVIAGRTRGQDFKAAVEIKDFEDLAVAGNFDGSIPADFIMDYMGIDNIEDVKGTLRFSGVKVGPLRLSNTNLTDVSRMKGSCGFDNVAFTSSGKRFLLKSGVLDLDRDTLGIAELALSTDTDQMTVSGWVTGIGDALQSGDPAYLRYDLSADAAKLNIGTWVPDASADAKSREPKIVPVSSKVSVPLRMPEGQLQLKAVRCIYQDMLMDAVNAEIRTWKHQILFDMNGHTSGGKIHAAGSVETEKGYLLNLQLSGQALEIRECFNQCGNFGQDVIRSQHVKGKCDLILLAEIPWTLDGDILNERIHVLAGLTMTDGELVGFDMLEQFSTYIHADDLKRVKFQRLDNFIEVRKGNVYIPAMFIQSNAANFVVNGVHTLDNRILYNMKINAGQVLSNKMKKHNPTLSPLPARKEGTFNLHFSISGTTEDFTYGMNRVSVESSFTQSAEMRMRIRDELRNVFGESVDLIEPPEWETIPEYHREVEGEETYLEWND